MLSDTDGSRGTRVSAVLREVPAIPVVITSERAVTVALAIATTTRSAGWRISSDFARSYSTYATNPKHFGSGGTREIAG